MTGPKQLCNTSAQPGGEPSQYWCGKLPGPGSWTSLTVSKALPALLFLLPLKLCLMQAPAESSAEGNIFHCSPMQGVGCRDRKPVWYPKCLGYFVQPLQQQGRAFQVTIRLKCKDIINNFSTAMAIFLQNSSNTCGHRLMNHGTSSNYSWIIYAVSLIVKWLQKQF